MKVALSKSAGSIEITDWRSELLLRVKILLPITGTYCDCWPTGIRDLGFGLVFRLKFYQRSQHLPSVLLQIRLQSPGKKCITQYHNQMCAILLKTPQTRRYFEDEILNMNEEAGGQSTFMQWQKIQIEEWRSIHKTFLWSYLTPPGHKKKKLKSDKKFRKNRKRCLWLPRPGVTCHVSGVPRLYLET